MSYLVLLDNFAEGDDLCVCEAGEIVNVLAAAEEVALVLCEAALAAEVGGRVGGALVGLCDPALDVVGEVV
jgi:urease accessory protein UreE